MTLKLHDFQMKVCRQVWRELYVNNHKSVLLQAPTGAGKTVMGAFELRKMLDFVQDFSATVFAHRREIIKQTAQKLSQGNVWPGIIMSGEVLSPSRPIQVCSVDSYRAWVKSGKINPLHPMLILIDECHRSLSPTYTAIIKEMMVNPNCKLLGLTATPIGTNGRGLGDVYEVMVQAPQVAALMEMGFLCPVQYKVGIIPDVSGVKLTASDYDAFELQAVLNQKMLIADVVGQWIKHGRGRPTMGFATGVAHSMGLVERFKALGVRAVHIDGDTLSKVRDDANADLMNNRIDMIMNCNVYVEGTDIPPIACIIDAQPTKSVNRFMQKGGRGLRICAGKQDLIYLDHAGNLHEHGRLEMYRPWELCKGKEMVEIFKEIRNAQRVERRCPVCTTVYTGLMCPACGEEYKRVGKEVDYLDAELVDMPHERAQKIQIEHSPAEKLRWYQEAKGNAIAMARKPGWADNCYHARWKEWPPAEFKGAAPRQPTDMVKEYMRKQLAHFAIKVAARKRKGYG